jgi:hypothetical protein
VTQFDTDLRQQFSSFVSREVEELFVSFVNKRDQLKTVDNSENKIKTENFEASNFI